MTPKESQEKKKAKETLEKVLLYTKDVSSYLDHINETLTEIMDQVKEYKKSKDEFDPFDLYQEEIDY